MSDLGKKIQYIFMNVASIFALFDEVQKSESTLSTEFLNKIGYYYSCLLYTSDAADEEDSVDLGGRRIIKKKKN